jgi:LmbE family N-acetylglucosaminyl deacetylase
VRTVILSPHCDDAPLSLGSALNVERFGKKPSVFVLFSLSRYTLDFPCNGSLKVISEIRRKEELAAARQANYEAHFCGLAEPFARPDFKTFNDIFDPQREVRADLTWKEARTKIADIFKLKADLILAPLGCGNHIDHRIVNRAAIECAQELPAPHLGFYEDLPYCFALGDYSIEQRVPVEDFPNLVPHTLTDSFEKKLALLRCYESQIDERQRRQVSAYWLRRGGERLWIPKPVKERYFK